MLHTPDPLAQLRNSLQALPQPHRTQAEHHLSAVRREMANLQQRVTINEQVSMDLSKQVAVLQRERESMEGRFKEALQHLEILLYQGDTQELRQRLTNYQHYGFSEESYSQLNTAFRENQESNITAFQPENTPLLSSALLEDSQLLNSPASTFKDSPLFETNPTPSEALALINSEVVPFQRKQEVWLQVLYGSEQDESLLHVSKEQITRKQGISELSPISLTEHCETKENSAPQQIQSMVFLKQKSGKKRSVPRTSAKKNDPKQAENEQQDKLKRKLIFTSKFEIRPHSKSKSKHTTDKPSRTARKNILSQI